MAASISELIDGIDSALYARLKTAVEIGRWPNGEALRQDQREYALQLVIAWERQHMPPHARTGYLPPRPDVSAASLELKARRKKEADANSFEPGGEDA